jgi:dimethylargininase
MRVGKTLYVGLSRRTNQEGIRQLSEIVKPSGYSVTPVPVHGCLHLKSACCYLGEDTLLVNRAWIDLSPLGAFRILEVPGEEPRSANVLRVGTALVVPSAFPHTRDLLANSGFLVRVVDVSELAKAEGGVTCTSVLFESRATSLP